MKQATLLSAICLTILMTPWMAEAQQGKESKGKESAANKGVRCCGLFLRTDFGHNDKLNEMQVQPDTALTNSIDSGKIAGLVEAFENYLADVDKEFGDAEHRDVVRSRLCKVFKSIDEDDAARAKLLMAAFRDFSFGTILEAKGLKERSIEQVRKSRNSFLKAVPQDSFCLMPVDLYLSTSLSETGKAAEAVSIAQSVVNRSRTAFGKRDEYTGTALIALGRAQFKSGNSAQAEQSLREGLAILSEAPEVQPNTYLLNCSSLAEVLLEEEKYQDAAELMEYLEPQIRKLFHEQLAPPVFSAVMMRGKALVGMNRLNDAEKALGRYPELVRSLRDPGVEGRNLLEVAADLFEKTNRADQAAAYRKWIARFDAHNENSTRK